MCPSFTNKGKNKKKLLSKHFDKFFLLHAMKAYRQIGGVFPLILNFSSR